MRLPAVAVFAALAGAVLVAACDAPMGEDDPTPEAFGLTFPVLGDPTAEVWDAWNVDEALPSHVIIDRDLVVRVRDTGSSDDVLQEWRDRIEELL
jgi:peroxiredoxin